MTSSVPLVWSGDGALRVALADAPSLAAHRRVAAACERLRRAAIPALRDITPAYTTVLIHFDPLAVEPRSAEEAVRGALDALPSNPSPSGSGMIEIPACYDAGCAPDLESVAAIHTLTPREVVEIHSGAEYTVAFLGFVPGFPYMLGLPERIRTPRLDSPRLRVPAGSIGIAGDQTGIYTGNTPGGWRLIGRTPRRMFDARRDPPSLLSMGDRVRFVPITAAEFRAMEREQA